MNTETTYWIHDGLGVQGLDPSLVDELVAAADQGGILQAEDMLRVLPGADPHAHNTCTLRVALEWAGGTLVVPEE